MSENQRTKRSISNGSIISAVNSLSTVNSFQSYLTEFNNGIPSDRRTFSAHSIPPILVKYFRLPANSLYATMQTRKDWLLQALTKYVETLKGQSYGSRRSAGLVRHFITKTYKLMTENPNVDPLTAFQDHPPSQ
eukprot:873633-Rhodomonas_salina.5